MRESPVEASEDSQNDSKPQTQDTSQNSNSETNSKTFAEFDSTPRFRKGFRRKKGESPYVCDMNVKFKKEKKQSTFLNPDPWARLVGSRNTAAIYIDGIATTALYDTGAELQLISKEFCEQNKLKIQPIEQLIECKGVVGTGLLEYDGYVEFNVQIPGRDFSEDHLFLVPTSYHPQSNGQCERFNSTLCNMLGTLSDEEKSDWKSHLGCMTHAYNCTKHASTTYSPYYLMFGRHPRLPIDVAFGLHKPNCSDNCSKSRYIQKLRRRLNYAHKKASKYSSEQAQKYKTSYDKSVKGPQLQVNDLVLVKIVAHKARHKIQDKWESEEYIVIEQSIPGTPVYRVRPVTGTKVRTLHRNLLLPLGVKYQPDIDSDESDSDDSVCVDTSHSRSNQPEKVSQAKSVRFQSELPKVGFEDRKGDVSQADYSNVDEDDINLPIPPMESVNQVPDVESGFGDSTGTSEHLIPDDVNLPSQYLVTQSDDSSDMEDTTTTELHVDSQVNEPNTEDDLPFIDSKIDSLVDTNEFLEFVDTLDDGEQTSAIEPKSVTESQFSSVMSYHEGDSTPLRDPSTDSQELSKSLDEESTEELASGTINQEDDSSHDNDVFASDTEKSSSQSVQDDSSVQNSNIVPSVEEDESENVISVEIAEPRRSGRERKQTALYGSPLLYTITCKLTPKFVPVFFNKMSETLESLQTNYLMEPKSDDSS